MYGRSPNGRRPGQGNVEERVMKTVATFLIVAVLALTGCATAPPSEGADSGAADNAMQGEVAMLRGEMKDLRSEIEQLRMEIIRLDARVGVLAHAQPGPKPSGGNGGPGPAKFWDTIRKISDVQVYWSGEVRGVQFYLCPVTKEEETKIFRDQLGDEYSYMWLQIANVSKEGTGYRFDPRKGLFTLMVEGEDAGGRKKFQTSFDPREVIKVRELQLGTKLGLSEHFEARDVLPGQTVQTHVLFPNSVDFNKVGAVYMGALKMREVRP